MKNIDIIIYSRDRACQLDLLLRSIKDKFLNVGKIHLIYTYSNDFYREGYKKLFESDCLFSNMYVTKQENFQSDVYNILKKLPSDVMLGLCDDDVVVKQCDCSEITTKLDETGVNAISLKAGLNIEGNYPNFVYPQPEFIETEPYLKWEWKRSHPESDWGYPTCINSYIFKKDYFLSLVSKFSFNNPPSLEGGLNTIKFKQMKPIMYSFKQSVLLNIPANRIQTLSPNYFDITHNYTATELNSKFLEGYKISTKNIYDSVVKMGNEEREFIFEKE